MEVQSIPLPFLIFSFMPFLFVVFQLAKVYMMRKRNQNLPPGPWKLPIIGNMHQLISSPVAHQRLRDLAKKHGPLMQLQLGQVSYIIISSAEAAKEVTKNHDRAFANRFQLLGGKIIAYDGTDIIGSHYGSYWRHLKKICMMELLSSKRVKSFRSIREEEVSKLIEAIIPRNGFSINLTKLVQSFTNDIIARAAFSETCKDKEAFLSIVISVSQLITGFSLPDFFPSIEGLAVFKRPFQKVHKQIDQILGNIIMQHREKMKLAKARRIGQEEEDLVDVLLKLQATDLEIPLSDDNIKAVIFDMFAAGTESTAITIDWAISEMLKNPRVLEKAQAEVRDVFYGRENVDENVVHELSYLNSVIKETLRLHPPICLVPRENSETCVINGYNIPAETRIFINLWAIGRDPKYWNEPERFKPERFLNSSVDYRGMDFEFIPFGCGRRICPGISFASANVVLPIAQLLYHFNWKLPGGVKLEDLDMSETMGTTIRRKEELILIPMLINP